MHEAVEIRELRGALLTPRSPADLPDQATSTFLLQSLNCIHADIDNFISNQPDPIFRKHLSKNLRDLLETVEDRYVLARIEDAVINQRASLGNNIFNPPAGVPSIIPNPLVLQGGNIILSPKKFSSNFFTHLKPLP